MRDSQHPRPSESFTSRDLGDEYLIYDRRNDQVHVLNGTARDILLLCDGSRSAGEVAAALVDKYGVDQSTARRDVERTIRELSELGAVDWV